MEHLVPADYRQLESRLEKGESKPGLLPMYGERIASIRSAITLYLMQCHSSWNDPSVQAWEAQLQNVHRSDTLLSIGQHYGLRTHLMDWSADLAVAFWFATHQWGTGNYVQGGDAVIYRVKLDALQQAEQHANNALSLTNPSQMFRHVDISGTPPVLAPRASAQKGFSVCGLESPQLLQAMIASKCISVHVFPRGVAPSSANLLTKTQLVPPFDQMANLFEECRQQGTLFQYAINWVTAQYPTLAATINDAPHIF